MVIKKTLKSLMIECGALKALHKMRGPSITILRYHSVLNAPENYENTIGSSIIHSLDQFREQMALLSRYYNPMSMDDVLGYLENNIPLPPYAVVVTFDDGYKDNLNIAAPILDDFKIPASFYVIVDSIAGQNNKTAWYMRVRKAFSSTRVSSWVDCNGKAYSLSDKEKRLNARASAMAYCAASIGQTQLDRIEEIERALEVPCFEAGIELMLNWDDIRALNDHGYSIGSHTMSHPNVAHIKEEDAVFEMTESKKVLEAKLGESVVHFAYPNPILSPNWNKTTRDLLSKAGYKTAVTCDNGCVRFGDDPLMMKRMFTPLDPDSLRWHIENTMNGFKV